MLKLSKHITIVFILLIFSYSPLHGQLRGALRGLVTDSATSEPLAYGNVVIQELKLGASTDDNGYFYIPGIPSGRKYTVIVSYLGYQTKSVQVAIHGNRINRVNFKLVPSPISLQAVEKTGERYYQNEASNISLDRISMKQLEMIPKGVEADIFRSLQYLPGVSSTGDISARYYVRGGAADQNLVLLNNMPVYSPFHALGLFSVIDPDMVSYVEFYKGGFTAEYSGRLSSLMKIVTRDGNKNSYHGSAAASFLTLKGTAEGPIPDGSFIITGRKSHSNDILKKFFNNKNVPVDFYDLSFNFNYSNPSFMSDAKFTVFGFFTSDYIDNGDPFRENFKWQNKIYGIKYFQWLTNSPVYYEVSVGKSYFSGEVIPNQSETRGQKNEVRDVTTQGKFTYILDNKNELEFGVKFMEVDTKLNLENIRGAVTNISEGGTNVSLFAKFKSLKDKHYKADFGTRFNFTRLAPSTVGEFSFEPRVKMSYQFIPELTLKGAFGIYEQELTTISDENRIITIFEPWIITPNYLKPATAYQYILGIETDFLKRYSVNIESYYKYIQNLPAINEKKYFPDDPDLVAGKGEAYGLEAGAGYKSSFLNFNLAYTLSYAFKEVNGVRYHPRYDSRNSFSVKAEFNLGNGWQTSVSWMYNSGLPFTQIVGYYNKLYFEDLGTRSYLFEPYTILASKNLGRLPDYHRLDFSLSKKFVLGFSTITVDFSVLNVYNRKNLFYFNRVTGDRVNMLPILPTATIKAEL